MKGLRRTDIGAAPVDERVRVVGRVRPIAAPVRSPLSERAGVYVRIEIRALKLWRPVIHTFASDQPFFIVDDSGIAAVHPRDADIAIVASTMVRADASQAADDYVATRLGRDVPTPLFVHEWILEVGATVDVLGTATWGAHLDASTVDGDYRGTHGQLHFARPLRIRARIDPAVSGTVPPMGMSEGYGAGQYLPAAWYPAGITAADVPAGYSPPGPELGPTLLAQLRLELPGDHALHGVELEPYLRSSPSGPVVFRRLDTDDAFVAVQLAWTSTGTPRVVFAGSWREFLESR